MTIPQHRAVARPGVDDDDGKLVGRARGHPSPVGAHAGGARLARDCAQLIVAEDPT